MNNLQIFSFLALVISLNLYAFNHIAKLSILTQSTIEKAIRQTWE